MTSGCIFSCVPKLCVPVIMVSVVMKVELISPANLCHSCISAILITFADFMGIFFSFKYLHVVVCTTTTTTATTEPMKQDYVRRLMTNLFCTSRFGSVISGAIQSKLFTKKGKNSKLNSSSTSKKHQRGSFSFLGGMQVKDSRLLSRIV